MTWTVRRSLLPFFPLLYISTAGIGWILEDVAERVSAPVSLRVALLAVFALAAIGAVIQTFRRRISFNSHEVVQHGWFTTERFDWCDLVDIEHDLGRSRLIFRTGQVVIRHSDVRGSGLIVAGIKRLGRQLDEPIHRAPSPGCSLKFGGMDRLAVASSARLYVMTPAILVQFVMASREGADFGLAAASLLLVGAIFAQAGLQWHIDETGISSTWFGLFRNPKMRWSEVELLTCEWPSGTRRCLLWGADRIFFFEAVQRKDRSLLDEVLGRIPATTPLLLNGAIPPPEKRLEISFEDN